MPPTYTKGRRRYDGAPMRRLRAQVKREEPYCWLCGGHIDPDRKAPDPLSFTLDHIVPVALGGPELDRANVRAAHMRCNQRRGKGKRQARRRSREW